MRPPIMWTENHERLLIWKRAMRLVEHVYRITRHFPQDEKSGLCATLRRGVTVVPGKIADAHGRFEPDEALASLNAAQGALRETQTNLWIARRLRFISRWELASNHKRCRKLNRMIEQTAEHILADQTALAEPEPSVHAAA